MGKYDWEHGKGNCDILKMLTNYVNKKDRWNLKENSCFRHWKEASQREFFHDSLDYYRCT